MRTWSDGVITEKACFADPDIPVTRQTSRQTEASCYRNTSVINVEDSHSSVVVSVGAVKTRSHQTQSEFPPVARLHNNAKT